MGKMFTTITQTPDLEIHAFVEGCMRLKGLAPSIDLQTLHFETKLMHVKEKHFFQFVEEQFLDLASTVASLYGEVLSTGASSSRSGRSSGDTSERLGEKRQGPKPKCADSMVPLLILP